MLTREKTENMERDKKIKESINKRYNEYQEFIKNRQEYFADKSRHINMKSTAIENKKLSDIDLQRKQLAEKDQREREAVQRAQ